MALAEINAATTPAEAQAAYDAVKGQVNAAEGEQLQQAIMARTNALAAMAREQEQKNALMMAAGAVDTSDLTDQDAIDAANTAIAALQTALDNAVDVSDADKAMYQMQLENANNAVTMAQDMLDTAGRQMAQSTALMEASGTLQQVLTALVGATPTQAQIDAANGALSDLQNAIASAADLSDADKKTYQDQVSSAMSQIGQAEKALMIAQEEAQEETDRVVRAMARKLYAGLDSTTGSLSSNTLLGRSSSNLSVDHDTTDTDAAVTVKPSGTMVAAINGWKGTDYVNSASGVTNHVVLYSNRGATSVSFLSKWGVTGGTAGTIANDDTGRIDQTGLTAQTTYIAGDTFASAGTKNHTKNAGDPASVTGTFDGVPGTYSCQQSGTTACASTVAASGFTLAGGWYFTPSSTTAMTSTPETDWQVFGWWSRETSDGVDVQAIAQEFTSAASATTEDVTALTIEGTATYRGGAAGKYAIYNPLGTNSSAGAFTADATLTANFSTTAANAKISGELTGFMSRGETMDWTVSLEEASIAAATGNDFSSTSTSTPAGGTVWTIGDTAAAKSGQWSGGFYGLGATTGVPQTATGTFSSGYDSIGRMEGAFGTTLEE